MRLIDSSVKDKGNNSEDELGSTIVTPEVLTAAINNYLAGPDNFTSPKFFRNADLIKQMLKDNQDERVLGVLVGGFARVYAHCILFLDTSFREEEYKRLLRNPKFWRILPMITMGANGRYFGISTSSYFIPETDINRIDYYNWLCEPGHPERFELAVLSSGIYSRRLLGSYPSGSINPLAGMDLSSDKIDIKQSAIDSVNNSAVAISQRDKIVDKSLWESINPEGKIFNLVNIAALKGLIENWISRGIMSRDLIEKLFYAGILVQSHWRFELNTGLFEEQPDLISKLLEESEVEKLFEGVLVFCLERGGLMPAVMVLRGIMSSQLERRKSSSVLFAKLDTNKYGNSAFRKTREGISRNKIISLFAKYKAIRKKGIPPTILVIDSPGENKGQRSLLNFVNFFGMRYRCGKLKKRDLVFFSTSNPWEVEESNVSLLSINEPAADIIRAMDNDVPFAGIEFVTYLKTLYSSHASYTTAVTRYLGRKR